MKRSFITVLLFLVISVFSYAQQARTLDDAIAAAANRIEEDISKGKQVAVLNFISTSENLSKYVIDELTEIFSSHNKLVVTERTRKDAILAERKVQTSLEVSDNEIRSIGNALGADYVISGQLDYTGTTYRLRAYAIDIARGTRVASSSIDVSPNDSQLAYFLGSNRLGAKPKSTGHFVFGAQAGGMWGLGTEPNSKAIIDHFTGTGHYRDMDTENSFGFFASLIIGYAFNQYFRIQTGTNISSNNGIRQTDKVIFVWDTRQNFLKFSYLALDIPLLPYLTFNPFPKFLFMIGVGPYISLPLSEIEFSHKYSFSSHPSNGGTFEGSEKYKLKDFNFGVIGGIGIGYKIGNGNIGLDVRYLSDILPISAKDYDIEFLTRRGFTMTLGYEYLF